MEEGEAQEASLSDENKHKIPNKPYRVEPVHKKLSLLPTDEISVGVIY